MTMGVPRDRSLATCYRYTSFKDDLGIVSRSRREFDAVVYNPSDYINMIERMIRSRTPKKGDSVI